MKHTAVFFVLAFWGCCQSRDVKLLNWNDNAIKLIESNCGATTGYLWEIYFHKNGSKSEKLIFKSYSSPAIETIRVVGDNLVIECGEQNSDKKIIEIDMKDIGEFIDFPVYYYKSSIRSTNSSFHEPEFIKKERED